MYIEIKLKDVFKIFKNLNPNVTNVDHMDLAISKSICKKMGKLVVHVIFKICIKSLPDTGLLDQDS